jgi:hypothetical protein
MRAKFVLSQSLRGEGARPLREVQKELGAGEGRQMSVQQPLTYNALSHARRAFSLRAGRWRTANDDR